jgi:hypothetical protein
MYAKRVQIVLYENSVSVAWTVTANLWETASPVLLLLYLGLSIYLLCKSVLVCEQKIHGFFFMYSFNDDCLSDCYGTLMSAEYFGSDHQEIVTIQVSSWAAWESLSFNVSSSMQVNTMILPLTLPVRASVWEAWFGNWKVKWMSMFLLLKFKWKINI